MCGRFASARKRQELLEEFGVQRDRVTEPLRPDYNVAPTKPVYAVITRRPEDGSGGQAAGQDASRKDGRGEDGSRKDGRGEDGSRKDGRGEDGSGKDGRGEDASAEGGSGQGGTGEHGALEHGALEHGGVRELRVVRWGLVPFWAKDTSIGSRLINARAETVATKPAFPPRVRPPPVPAPCGRLLRVGEVRGPQAPAQAAVLHPPRGRRRAGLRRPVRALARQGPARG